MREDVCLRAPCGARCRRDDGGGGEEVRKGREG